MPEHIDYLRKLSCVGERHNDRPSLLKAKQLLHKENLVSLSLSKKVLHIYSQKCYWKYTLHNLNLVILELELSRKDTNVWIDRLSDLPQNVKVTKKGHSNSKQNEQLCES